MLEFRLLGPVECLVDERVVQLGPPQQRAVLAALLVDAGTPVPGDTLIGRVWGEMAPRAASTSLHSHIARIRRLLQGVGSGRTPPVAVQRRSGGYVLDVDVDHIDLHRFQRLVRQAGDVAGGPPGHQHTAELLRQALGLWRGEALTGVAGSWAEQVRVGLDGQRNDALLNWAAQQFDLDHPEVVVAPLAEAVARNPFAEPLIAAQMRALFLAGRAAEALQCFARARTRLAEELGTEPGTDLRSVHEAVLRGERHLLVRSGGGPSGQVRPAVPVPAQLPTDVPAFTGRGGEMSTLERLRTDADPRLARRVVAVCGTAGVGKTALVVHWAHRVRREFPDGQLYADLRGFDLEPPVAAADVLESFLRALGVPGNAMPADPSERSALYRSLLANRRMLIVLDNAPDAGHVRPLLPGGEACFTVVTSRDSLAALVARHGAHRIDVDLLPAAESVELLRILVGDRVATDQAAADALAARCARLPLALRIIAEYLIGHPGTSPASLAHTLTDEQRRLDVLDAGGEPRTAVRGVLAWSYRTLPPPVARAMRLLSVPTGAQVDRYAARALFDTDDRECEQLLDALVRAYVLQVVGPDQFQLHDLLRAYAREQLDRDGAGDRHDAVRRWLDHCLAACAAAMDVLVPSERHRRPAPPRPATPLPPMGTVAQAQAWLDAHRAALVTAAAQQAEGERREWPVALAATMFRYLEAGAHYGDAEQVLGCAHRAAVAAGDRAGEAAMLRRMAVVKARRGRFAEAGREAGQALAIFEDLADRPSIAEALNNLGAYAWQLADHAQAWSHLRHACEVFAEIGEQAGLAVAYGNLAGLCESWGRYDAAIDYARRAMDTFTRNGDEAGAGRTLAILGSVHERLERFPEALDYYQRSLAALHRAGARNLQGRAMGRVARVHARCGRPEQARNIARQALLAVREVDDRQGQTEIVEVLAQVQEAVLA